MANINWNRHSYRSQLDRDYYNDPKSGFDKSWHDRNRKQKAQAQQAKLKMQRERIKALRTNKTQG